MGKDDDSESSAKLAWGCGLPAAGLVASLVLWLGFEANDFATYAFLASFLTVVVVWNIKPGY